MYVYIYIYGFSIINHSFLGYPHDDGNLQDYGISMEVSMEVSDHHLDAAEGVVHVPWFFLFPLKGRKYGKIMVKIW